MTIGDGWISTEIDYARLSELGGLPAYSDVQKFTERLFLFACSQKYWNHPAV